MASNIQVTLEIIATNAPIAAGDDEEKKKEINSKYDEEKGEALDVYSEQKKKN